MLKSGLETVGKAANVLFGVTAILRAHDEYINADAEHEQEKFDDFMRTVGGAILPFEGQVLMYGPDIVADGIIYLHESGIAGKTVDIAKTAACGLYKFVKSKF